MKINFKREEGFNIHGDTYNSFRKVLIETPVCGGVRIHEKKDSNSIRLEFGIAGMNVSKCEIVETSERDGYKKTLNETVRNVEAMTDRDGAISKYICGNRQGKTTHVFDAKSGVSVVTRRSDGYCTDVYNHDFKKGIINYNRIGSDNNRGIMVTNGNELYDHLQKVLEYISHSNYFYGKDKKLDYARTWDYNDVYDKYTFKISDEFIISLFKNEYKHIDTDKNYIDLYFDAVINKMVCVVYLGADFRAYEMDYAEGQTWKYIFDDINTFNIEIYNEENIKVESRKISNMMEVERYILIKNTVGDIWLPAGYNVLGSYIIINKEGDYCIKSKYDTHCSKTHYKENKTCKNGLQLAILTYDKVHDVIAMIIEEWLDCDIYEVNYLEYGNKVIDAGYTYTITRRAVNRITGIKDEWDRDAIHNIVLDKVHKEFNAVMNVEYGIDIANPYIAPEDVQLLKSPDMKKSYSIKHIGIIDGKHSEYNTYNKYADQITGVSIIFSICYEVGGLMVLREYEMKVNICEKEAYKEAYHKMMTESVASYKQHSLDDKTSISESKDGLYVMLIDKKCFYTGIKVIKEKEYDIDKSKYILCIDGKDYNANLNLDDVTIMHSLYEEIRGGIIYGNFR